MNFALLMSIFKVILPIITMLQTTLNLPGIGAVKLAIAKEVLSAAFDAGESVPKNASKEDYINTGVTWISRLVGIFNDHGVLGFGKSATPSTEVKLG